MSDVERAIQAVLDSQHAAYVHLLNAYLALLTETAALRAELARLTAAAPAEPPPP